MRATFRGAHVIIGDGQSFDDGFVTVESGRIVGFGSGDARDGGEVVDLEGFTLMPGMIDLHTHLVGGDKAIGHGDEATTFKMADSPIRAALEGVEAARRTLHAGITTVREIAARDYIDVELKRAQSTGGLEGPRIRATGPGVFMTGGHGWFFQPGREADGVTEIIKRVRELVSHGVDVIKIVSADGPETLGEWTTVQTTAEEAVACFAEARRLGRITASHAMGPEAIKNVCRAGVDTVEHGWYLDEESCAVAIEHGSRLVPTLGNVVAIIHDGPKYEMPWAEMMAADEQAIFERYSMAIEMGVPIAMGSDCGGNEAHRHGNNAMELEAYVRCGMSPMAAITAATLEAAKVLRLESEIGSIAEGKIADLIVIDGNPLDDIAFTRTRVIGVVQAGRVIRDDLGVMPALRSPAILTV